MSFPRYPKYKPSGVSWFGDAPEHWPTIRYKNVFKEKQSVSGDSLPSGSISFGRVVFKSDKILHELTKASYQEVLAGEFLINPINLNYDLKSLRTGLSDINTCVSPAYIVLRAKAESDKNYLKYQLHLFDVSHMKTLGAGVRQTITFGDIGTCSTCLPPLAEQTAIAEFLGRETGKIDGLVAEQRRLMELLKEKSQAVISHAVTKGLNPHAPMKPSGIEWLDDVPAGWRIVQLSMLAKMIQTGPFGSQLHSEDYVENGIPVVNPSNIQDGKIEPDWSCSITAEDANRLSQHKLIDGDIVFGRRGEMGRCALVSSNEVGWICGTGSLNVRLLPEAFPPFISIYLRTEYVREWLKLESVGSTMDNLNTQILGAIKLPLPNLSEQTAIVTFLDTELAKFDTLTAEAQRAIGLLQERRTALISAAVTGQIDVRSHPKN